MKYILIIGLFAISACSTKKIVESTKSNETVITNADVNSRQLVKDNGSIALDYSVSNFVLKTDSQNVTENVRIIDYDTSKPVVNRTGKPPVIREMIITRNKNSGSRTENKITDNKNVIENKKLQLDVKTKIETKTKLQAKIDTVTKVSSTRSGVRWWVWAVGAMLVVVVTGIVTRKIKVFPF